MTVSKHSTVHFYVRDELLSVKSTKQYLLTSRVNENRFQLKLIYIICNLTLKLFGKLFACGKMSTFR